MHPQPGIFALGTPHHSYLELDLLPDAGGAELAAALAGLTGPATTVAGVSVVVGLRPELWAQVAPQDMPPAVSGFTQDLRGAGGYRMPATQHDAWVWVAGGSRAAVFDSSVAAVRAVAALARVATEVAGWLYTSERDLTGFVDGTENPPVLEAVDVATVPAGPGAGSSVVLVQKWRHESSWAELAVPEQERVIGRTKDGSIELDEQHMPADSHVSRTVLEVDGEELPIYRRNTAYGGVLEHGTSFVAFSREQSRFVGMLRQMAGSDDGVRDALTRHATALTGAYYVAPSQQALARLLPPQA